MRITAIIPCYNGVEDTRACLASLREQRCSAEIEILIVDNASQDATPNLGAEWDGVRVLTQEHNLGFAGGVNAGLAEADGDLILVINNDTQAAPHMVARLCHGLLSDTRIAAVAPVSNHVKGPARIAVGDTGVDRAGRERIEAELTGSCGGMLQDLESLSGVCLLVRRDVLQRIGPFDPRYGFGNFEDDDLSLRARLAGYRLVVVRDAFLHHQGHQTFHALGLDYREFLLERRCLFVKKWRSDPAGRAVIAQLENRAEAAPGCAVDGLRLHPSWSDGHWLLGRAASRAGDTAAAVRHLDAFVRACPRHGEARALLAVERMRAGDPELGQQELTWTLQNCFFSEEAAAEALSQLGQWYRDSGDPTRALESMRSAVELSPDDGELHNLLGAALLDAGDVDAALAHFEVAEEKGSQYGTTNRGICLWRLQRRGEAIVVLTRAAELAPHDPVPRGNLEAALAAERSSAAQPAARD